MPTTTNKKSNSGTKKASASKGGNSSKKTSKNAKQLTLEEIISKKEFTATVIFVLGIFTMILVLFAGSDGSIWNKLHTFYVAVFGITGYYIPSALLFSGTVRVLDKRKPVYSVKIFEILLLLVIASGLIHVNTFSALNTEAGYGESVKLVFGEIMSHSTTVSNNGGVIGALFGGALYQLGKSRILANILLFALLFADVMFLFGITLFKLLSKMEKPAKKVGQYTGEAIESAKSDIEKIKTGLAESKERKLNENAVNPTLIVDDFYKNNPQAKAPAVASKKGLRAQQKDENAAVEQSSAGGENVSANAVPTIFDIAEKDVFGGQKSNSGTTEFSFDNLAKFQDINAAGDSDIGTAVGVSEDDCKVVQLDAAEQNNSAVKVQPFTDEEKTMFENELNSGLENREEKAYIMPPIDCLKLPRGGQKNFDANELKTNGEKLIAALNSFNVQASIVDVVPGPTVTRYELSPAPGVKISKFVGLSDDLALHMAAPAGLRIEAPIPNKAAIGIEIPNKNKVTVTFREIIDNEKFKNSKSKLNVALGKDIAGDIIFSDIAKMPHLLVAGTTGSGKSVCLNTMIMSILYNATPDEVKIILIDPKQVEFGVYNGLPHLLVPVVSDPRKASGALGWAVTEMLNRYKTLNANGVRDVSAYNQLCDEREDLVKMPQIVIFIDELSDLMTVAPAEVEDSIQRLAQMARAAGMHLVVATQRPSVDVITGVIKANIPSRIALTVKSQIDSRTIIDSAGAEKLMGYGDMLYYPVGVPKPIRVQGAYLSDKEIETVVDFIKSNGVATYDDSVQQEIERQAVSEKKKGITSESSEAPTIDKDDELLKRAVELFVSAPEKASISALQRHLSLGFAKAGRLMDTLEQKGIVGPTEGSKPRKVLITKNEWYEMNAMSSGVAENNKAKQDDKNEVVAQEVKVNVL